MHLNRIAAIWDVSASGRVMLGLALMILCRAQTEPRTISLKPVLLSFFSLHLPSRPDTPVS